MKGELFFLFLSKITLACCKKSEERQCVKTFNLIRLELNKTHQELSKEQRIIPNCICNSSKILPGALRAPADSRPPGCGCTISKAGGGTTLISCCCWGEEAGHRDTRGNSTGPGSRSSLLSVQCLSVLTTSIPGSGLPTRPSAATSPPVLLRPPVFCQQLCRDDLQEEGGQLRVGELGSSSIYEGLCPHLLCFAPPASGRKMKTLILLRSGDEGQQPKVLFMLQKVFVQSWMASHYGR